jgi:hypothetical protein
MKERRVTVFAPAGGRLLARRSGTLRRTGDITQKMYGNHIIGSLSANDLFDFFTGSNDYISLQTMKAKEEGENEIWQQYVDKGFLVFYSKKNQGSSGHIETCFPNGISEISKTYQSRHSNDTRYPGENTLKLTEDDKNLFVGAGGAVGYKTQTKNWRKGATPFLYLGFLKL